MIERGTPPRWSPIWAPAFAAVVRAELAMALCVSPAFALSAAARRQVRMLHSCTYEFRNDVQTFAQCARVDARGGAHVAPRHLRRLTYDRHGLAAIFVDHWYLVRRNGRNAPVMSLDNWAEGFADGRARSERGGKVGYIDRRLRLSIPRRYDGAYPFAHGTAAVCIGCRMVRTGEYSSYVGGLWGCIDIHGALLGAMRRQDQGGDCRSPR
jgi:hypothetical protein